MSERTLQVADPQRGGFYTEELSLAEWDDMQERAAIMEHDGGLSREQAEAEAIRIVLESRGAR